MKQFNGIIAAESVVRDARHLLNTAQNHGLLSTMTSATVEVKLKTVKSKSDAGLLALYLSENPGFVFETEEDGGIDADALTARGLELIENLQHVKKCLEVVLELVRGHGGHEHRRQAARPELRQPPVPVQREAERPRVLLEGASLCGPGDRQQGLHPGV